VISIAPIFSEINNLSYQLVSKSRRAREDDGVVVTDENGHFDGWGHDLTLIVVIDRRVGLSLSRGERVWS